MSTQKKLSELNKGAWSGATAYTVGDIVTLSGSSYICVANSTNNTPPNATYWALLSSKGDKGDKGDTGSQGIQGIQGIKGSNWKGDWNSSTAYVVDDVVYRLGSSYICIQAHTNHEPPSASYWELVAQKGADGEGSGDVMGPNSSVTNRVAVFDGLTGKIIKDGGKTIAEVEADSIPVGYLDTDGALTANSDTKVPSQKAVKTYADTKSDASKTETLTNKTLTSPKVGTAINDTNGNEIIKTPATANAVNEITVTNSATGNAVQVGATGDDTNIDIQLVAKGTGGIKDKNGNYFSTDNSIYRQALINGGCQVNQAVTAVNLTSEKLFGPVDMFYAKGQGTAVSAGTITQSSSPNCGGTGYSLKLSGVTLTGTGKINAYTFIESINAKFYKNKYASFGVKVYHDVGSAIDYVIKINKANSADNFSAVTNISTATVQSVANTTETLIKFQNVSMGDCSNGIEIEIEAACGAITTKNFEFSEWQFNLGPVLLPFSCRYFGEELIECQRYYEKSYNYSTAPGTATQIGCVFTVILNSYSNYISTVRYSVHKRAAGILTQYSTNNANTPNVQTEYTTAAVYVADRAISTTIVGTTGFMAGRNNAGTGGNHIAFQWVADARPTIA